MAKSVAIVGVDPEELHWLRLVLGLLRHPDPNMSELTRQALTYLAEGARLQANPQAQPLDHAG